MQRRTGDRQGSVTLPAGPPPASRRSGPYRPHRSVRSPELAHEVAAVFAVDGPVVEQLRSAVDDVTALVTVDLEDLVRGRGAGEGRWHGPIPVSELERLATNATIHVLGLDVNGLPIALSRAHEHVTASQYLALA